MSIDSTYSHGAFAAELGGIRYPLLSDFHPKGAVAASFGLYLEAAGITDRATVLIDASGVIRHISSVTPSGKRDMSELLRLCQELDAAYEGEVEDQVEGGSLPEGMVLYVRDSCMFSRWALYARANLGLADSLPVVNVSQDAEARGVLEAKGGKAQAPALDTGDGVLYESADIAAFLTSRCALT